MKKLLNASFLYLIVGLLGGLYYREFTKHSDFPEGGYTQLAVVHTHVLVLGFLVLLVILILEKVFALSQGQDKLFTWFFWIYNAGVVVTVGMLFVHGTLQVLGAPAGPAISGIAGLGHILLSAGMIMLFVLLRRAVARAELDARS